MAFAIETACPPHSHPLVIRRRTPIIRWRGRFAPFPIIDIMLGGEGKSGEVNRELSEIEEQILEGIVRIICRDLQTSWQAIKLEFNFAASQQISQVQRLMPPDEKNLC